MKTMEEKLLEQIGETAEISNIIEAQVTYTAMMTDTLIARPESEE